MCLKSRRAVKAPMIVRRSGPAATPGVLGAGERSVRHAVRRVEDVAGIAQPQQDYTSSAMDAAVHTPHEGGDREAIACLNVTPFACKGATRVKRRLARTAAARGRSTSGVGDAREYLERLARILVRSGHSPRSLLQAFAEV